MSRYTELFNEWNLTYSDVNGVRRQKDCNNYWKSIKHEENLDEIINEKIQVLKEKREISKNRFFKFFRSKTSANPTPATTASTPKPSITNEIDSPSALLVADLHFESEDLPHASVSYPRPAQEKLNKKLKVINSEIANQLIRHENGASTSKDAENLEKLKAEKKQIEGKLKKLNQRTINQKFFRDNAKRKLQNLVEENPELAKKIRVTKKKGKPSIVEQQPEFLRQIVQIITRGCNLSAASDRRRDETLRSVRTLDDLTSELRKMNSCEVSRSSVYLHLQPKNSRTIEGKRHVTTVPVRLLKPSNDLHKAHPDTKFCFAIMQHIYQLASFLGPSEVVAISQDDKAKVPIGTPAATHQTPLLMHLEYKIRLMDHDFVVAPRHLLTPSVYAFLEIQSEKYGAVDAVTYSGPTFISIRASKYTKSTALSHARDLTEMCKIECFNHFLKTSENLMKPVVLQLVDGGPDENPRFTNVIQATIHNFVEYSLDTIIVATNAPGRSAFNRVERRMAPLSRHLSGLILPHDKYGTHLDSAGKTIDEEKEKKNFQYAGEALAEVFSDVVIDGHPTFAQFVTTQDSEIPKEFLNIKTEQWIAKHVRSSQYMLQVTKCFEEPCCGKPRGKYLEMFPERFLPAPIPLSYNPQIEQTSGKGFQYASLFQTLFLSTGKKLPYDTHCPTVQKNCSERTCCECQIYFASLSLLKDHLKAMHRTRRKIKLPKTKRMVCKDKDQVLVVIDDASGEEHFEWVEEELINNGHSKNLKERHSEPSEEVLPVFNLDNHFRLQWENIND